MKRIEVFILFLLSLTPLTWLWGNWVVFGHDSGFRPNVSHHLMGVWNGWYTTVNTGIDWSLYKGFLIIQGPELLSQTLFGSLETAQLFVLPFWFFLMAIGMYVCVWGFFPERKYWFLRMYTSIFWIFNFYVLQAWGIAERAKFSLYAALPISVLLISKTFQRKIPIPVTAVLFGMLYFFCNGGASPPLFGASVVVWGVTTLLWSIWFMKKEGWKSLLRGCVIFISCIAVFALFNTYWILVEAELYRGTYTNVVASEGGVEGLLRWEQVISKHASLTNLLRLQGIPDWYENPNHPFSNTFLTNPLLIIISFLPISSIAFGLVFLRKKIKTENEKILIILLGVLLFVGLFFAAGSHTPTGFLYILFMKYVPGFAVFRSSFYKFSPVLWLSIIMLSGFFIQQLLFFLQGRKKIFLSIFILAVVLLYHYPFFNPSFFQFDTRFSTRLQIPEYVKDVGRFLDSDKNETGRVLLLPELDRGYISEPIDSYTWGFYSLDVLPRLVSNRSILANDSQFEIVQALYDKAYESDWKGFSVLAEILGVTQILYREDEKVSTGKPARWIHPSVLESQFGKATYKKGHWSVYSLATSKKNIVVENNIVALTGNIQNESSLLIRESSRSALARISWEDTELFDTPQIAVQAECMYCADEEYKLYIQSIFLPQLRFLPGSFLYPIFGERKIPKVTSTLTVEQTIDLYLSRSLFRLSEAKRLVDSGKPYDISREDYEYSLKQIHEHFGKLNGRELILYANRINAYLTKQRETIVLLPKEIPQSFVDLEEAVKSHLWISDEKMYRYIVVIPSSDQFIPTVSSNPSFITIDTKLHMLDEHVELSEGIHFVEIPKDKIQSTPSVFFRNSVDSSVYDQKKPVYSLVSETPTETVVRIEESSVPYILTLPFTYDNRWQAMVNSGKVQIIKHVMTNGYANGWLIKADGAIEVRIFYTLKAKFYQGIFVSFMSILLGIIVLYIFHRRNSRKV